MFNDTYDETSPFYGWSAKQIATAVGRNFREGQKTSVEKAGKPECGECDVPGNEPPDVSAGATPSYTTSEARERSLEGDADSTDAEPPVTVKAEPKVLQPMSASSVLAYFEEYESFLGRYDFTDEDGVVHEFDPAANAGE